MQRGDHQDLQHQVGAAPVPRHECNRSGQVAACAVTAHRDPLRIEADLRSVVGDPLRRRVTVLRRRGKLVLRGQPVLDRRHAAIRSQGQPASIAVVGIDAAENEAAAVKRHEDGERIAFGALVEPDQQLAAVRALR